MSETGKTRELRERLKQVRNDLEFVRADLNWHIVEKMKVHAAAKKAQNEAKNDRQAAYYRGIQYGIDVGLSAARSTLNFIDNCYPEKRQPTLRLIRGGRQGEDENAPRQRGEG